MDYFPPLCMAGDQILHHMAAGAAAGGGVGGGAEVAPSCPRCASTNTKFCYYNNYSLTQPRYLCKTCRRYWTRGGSLRNVPMGGGCRKSRRSKAARSAATRTGSLSSRSYAVEDNSASVAAADIDMATVFAKFLNQSSSSADSVGRQDSDGVGFVRENDENALVFPDQGILLEADQEGLFWSDTNSSEMSNFMTWQAESPFPSDEFWSSGFDFSGLEALSGSPSNAEN